MDANGAGVQFSGTVVRGRGATEAIRGISDCTREIERPRNFPGAFLLLDDDGLGDALEASVGEAGGIGSVDGNRSTDDLGDEVIPAADDPDVSGLIDRSGAPGV